MDSPKYASLCVSLCGSLRWNPRHTEHSDNDFPQNDSSCVSVYRSRIWNIYHTEHSDMSSPQHDFKWFFMWWLNLKPLHRAQLLAISKVWLFMCIAWWFLKLPPIISSTRNHLFLQSAFNMARTLLSLLASLCLLYPPGIIFFFLHGVGKMAFLWLFHLPVIINVLSRAPSMGPGLFYTYIAAFPLLFHPPGVISFVCMALRSCWFPAIYVDRYGIVIFADKGYMCKVIAAMLISTNRLLIPGTNHYYLWS